MGQFNTQADAEVNKAYNEGIAIRLANTMPQESVSNDTTESLGSNSENNILNNSSIVDVAYKIISDDTSDNRISGEQNEVTQEEINKVNPVLKAPLNPTDPIVWHDPTFVKGIIIKPVTNEFGENSNGVTNIQQASHKIDGIFIPLLQVNETVIKPEDIMSMTLSSTNICPELEVTINDIGNKLNAVNSPGINNKVMLMIMPPIDGVYKKIQLPFYITDILPLGDSRKTLFCRFKLLGMEQKRIGEMNYPDKNEWPGCDRCKQPAAEYANTWETLHYIAKETGLGFASTEQCKEIDDRQPRRFNDSYLNSISDILGTAGKENDSIFDAWIDLYGYITMVNLPWVLNNEVDASNLAIYGLRGYKNTEGTGLLPEPNPELVNRMLTNSMKASDMPHNLRYDTYKIHVDNDAYESGTLTTYRYFSPLGAGGNNNMVEFQIQISENSKQGLKTDEYETQNVVYLGIDMSGLGQLKQEVINKSYMKSKKMKRMELHLPEANFGLQRGTLINLVIMETDPTVKYHIVYSSKNLYEDSMDIDQHPLFNTDEIEGDKISMNEIITNGDIELPNTALSGLYYIDGMEYKFSQNMQKIEQVLYLIKKGPWGSFVDPHSIMPINTEKDI